MSFVTHPGAESLFETRGLGGRIPSAPSEYVTEVAVPFEATTVPKGGRKARKEWFFAMEKFPIRVVEARTGFVIRFPKTSRFEANELDVVHHKGRNYWPMHFDAERSCMRGTCGNVLAKLRCGEGDLLGLLPEGVSFPHFTLADMRPRQVVSSDLEAASARVRRKLDDNVLIVGHKIYQLGGEPIWVQRHAYKGPKLGIASTGAYRTKSDRGLRTEVGHFLHKDVQQCIGWGRFYAANDGAGARSWYKNHANPVFPQIEVLIDSAVSIPREQVWADALFLTVADLLTRYRGTAPLPASCTEEGLGFASEPVADPDLTRRRLRVLVDFASTNEGDFDYRWMEDRYGPRRAIDELDPRRWLDRYRQSP